MVEFPAFNNNFHNFFTLISKKIFLFAKMRYLLETFKWCVRK